MVLTDVIKQQLTAQKIATDAKEIPPNEEGWTLIEPPESVPVYLHLQNYDGDQYLFNLSVDENGVKVNEVIYAPRDRPVDFRGDKLYTERGLYKKLGECKSCISGSLEEVIPQLSKNMTEWLLFLAKGKNVKAYVLTGGHEGILEKDSLINDLLGYKGSHAPLEVINEITPVRALAYGLTVPK
jgi:hypothetical protein